MRIDADGTQGKWSILEDILVMVRGGHCSAPGILSRLGLSWGRKGRGRCGFGELPYKYED